MYAAIADEKVIFINNSVFCSSLICLSVMCFLYLSFMVCSFCGRLLGYIASVEWKGVVYGSTQTPLCYSIQNHRTDHTHD